MGNHEEVWINFTFDEEMNYVQQRISKHEVIVE